MGDSVVGNSLKSVWVYFQSLRLSLHWVSLLVSSFSLSSLPSPYADYSLPLPIRKYRRLTIHLVTDLHGLLHWKVQVAPPYRL